MFIFDVGYNTKKREYTKSSPSWDQRADANKTISTNNPYEAHTLKMHAINACNANTAYNAYLANTAYRAHKAYKTTTASEGKYMEVYTGLAPAA